MKTTILSQEELTQYKKQMKSVLNSIKNGKIYAKVNKVSSSWMTRYISFYRIYKNRIVDITPEIAWIRWDATIWEYKQGANWLIDSGLRVWGCWMDMIFHTLYTCMPYKQARKWNQRYNTL